jgi:hypothetical protein
VAATAANVVEHATLYRISFVADLANVTCFSGADGSVSEKNPPSQTWGSWNRESQRHDSNDNA